MMIGSNTFVLRHEPCDYINSAYKLCANDFSIRWGNVSERVIRKTHTENVERRPDRPVIMGETGWKREMSVIEMCRRQAAKEMGIGVMEAWIRGINNNSNDRITGYLKRSGHKKHERVFKRFM